MIDMKGMALDTIGFMIIALVGVLVLILLVSGSFTDMGRNAFCYFYQKVLSKNLDMCEPKENIAKKIEIEPEDSEDLARYIAAYSILCWEEATKSLKTKDTTCYSLSIEGGPWTPPISEFYLTQNILVREGGCTELENNLAKNSDGTVGMFDECGDSDQMNWDVDGNVISDQKLILIKYDDTIKQIIVKG